MTDRKMNKADFYTSIVMLALSLTIVIMSLGMPSMVDKNESQWSNPGVVPAFIGFALLLLSGSMFVRAIMRRVFKRDGDEPSHDPSSPEAASSNKKMGLAITTQRILITIALCIGYALLLGKIWFPLATFIFVFFFISIFEFDAHKKLLQQWKTFLWAAVIGVGTAALVTIVFQYLFLVNLP